MRYTTPLLAAAGTLAGLAASVAGYQLATAPVAAQASQQPVAAVGRPAPTVRMVTRYAPCTPPAELRHDVCVTHEWRTKVVPDQAPPPASAPAVGAARQPGATPVRTGSHGGDDDGYGEQEHEHEDD